MAQVGKVEDQYAKQGFSNLFVLSVYKYHKVMFAGGRTIEILTMEDGKDYVPNIAEKEGKLSELITQNGGIPKNWSIRGITLKEDLILEIPCPARVCFFRNGFGFHGPVNLEL